MTENGWKTPEKAYIRYLEENGERFITTEIHGFDKIPNDFGYAVAALVFVFDNDNKKEIII